MNVTTHGRTFHVEGETLLRLLLVLTLAECSVSLDALVG
jgi:hypothetical protein